MEITKKNNGENIILQVEGRIDTVTNVELQKQILEAFQEAKDVVLDFTEVTYVSSAGLRALLIGQKTAMSKGGSMTLENVADSILKVLKVSGFDGILNIK